MKKMFEIIGLLSLAYFSFFVTEKTSSVFENVDNIMLQIRENSYKYNIDKVEGVINDDTIIPGISGRYVNIKKSYKKMKKYGFYNESLYVYDYIKPDINLGDNIDKYVVSGNKNKRDVSLIFIVNDNINYIIDILNNNNVKGNFFVNDIWFEENSELVLKLIKDGHIIGNLGNNYDYSDSSFGWMDTIIKILSKQKQGYCYYTNNKVNDRYCINYKNNIIKPTIINNNPFLEVKNYLCNGIMLSFNIDNKVINELDSIIKYIKAKGYNIVNIETLLSEKNLK